MPWATIAPLAAASIIGGVIQGNAAQKAGESQAQAANNAANLQYQMFQQQQANMQPWLQTGKGALTQLGTLTGPGGSMSQMPTAQDILTQLSPNYQFQLQQGLGQAQNMGNSVGGLVSGNEMQGLNQFAQNFAGNAYQNAFNNYQTAQGNIFNRLANIANMGANAGTGIMGAGMNTAANMGNFQTSGAAAQAAGNVGMANALNQGLGNIGNMYLLSKMGVFGANPAGAGGGTSLTPMG